jgi:hypothetical protein
MRGVEMRSWMLGCSAHDSRTYSHIVDWKTAKAKDWPIVPPCDRIML